jgi:hypothetical protein
VRPDWPTILRSVSRWTLVWVIVLGIATWQGAPEVICATPLIWPLSTRIGLEIAAGTPHKGRQRWADLALAGALFAGVLAVVVGLFTPLNLSATESERGELPGMALFSTLVMMALGTPVCIAFSTLTGWLYARSRGLQ